MLPLAKVCIAALLAMVGAALVNAGSPAEAYELPQSTPASEIVGGYLNGYRIGDPPPGSNKHPQLYAEPRSFIEVTPENMSMPVSPHFTLGQFLCKQEAESPKYIVLQERILTLLEGLIGAVQAAGYPVETFGVISGYRTPYYNKRIGNVPNSRHVYGDAMDFYVDVNKDGRMDDLNGDGQHNRADVDILFEIVSAFKRLPKNADLVGGVGHYYKTSNHGGFIHVDTRGYKARW